MNISDILIGVNPSALDYPLIHTNWLLDYKINGQKSYVYKDKDILHELYRSPISANDEDIRMDAFNYFSTEQQDYLGIFLSKVYELRNNAKLKQCKSISDIVTDQDCLDSVKKSDFADAFFALPEVINKFATTDGLKVASEDDEIMNLLESSSEFITAVASNPDIQSLSGSPLYGESSISVNNAYVISITVGGTYCVKNNYTYRSRGACTAKYHGQDAEISIVDRSHATGGSDQTVSKTINKYVKTLTVHPSNYLYAGGDTTAGKATATASNMIRYIQLDTVV